MSSQGCYPVKSTQINELLDILSHPLRREIIYFFENHTDSSTAFLDEVVLHIDDRVPEEFGEELSITLYHTHLPKLDAAGWLDYDRTTDRIHYYGDANAERLLEELQAVFSS